MATVKNVIQTNFTTTGAKNAQTVTEGFIRTQTRLAQTSASAGRSFAAQSQGLGGLVAAYAGAAATTFALQQAFDKLAASARASQTLEGLTSLASSAGQNANELLTSIREITKNQLTLIESAQQASLALSAGFDTRQIEQLSEVALRASRALGRDLTDSMTRVVRGSAKMETELLDELGIYTRIEAATRAYAQSLGRSVSSLTDYERRQAFVNSVIDQGLRKFSAINTTIPTVSEKIEAFGTRILDFATQFGIAVTNFIEPFIDFLNNNLSSSLSAFALIAGLVAKKSFDVLKEGASSATSSILAWGAQTENSIKSAYGLSSALSNATNEIRTLNIATLSLTEAEKDTLKNLVTISKSRALTNAELRLAQELISSSNSVIASNTAAIQDNIDKLKQQQQQLEKTAATEKTAAEAAIKNSQDYATKLAKLEATQKSLLAQEKTLTSQRDAQQKALAIATQKYNGLLTERTTLLAGETTIQAALAKEIVLRNATTESLTKYRSELKKASADRVSELSQSIASLDLEKKAIDDRIKALETIDTRINKAANAQDAANTKVASSSNALTQVTNKLTASNINLAIATKEVSTAKDIEKRTSDELNNTESKLASTKSQLNKENASLSKSQQILTAATNKSTTAFAAFNAVISGTGAKLASAVGGAIALLGRSLSTLVSGFSILFSTVTGIFTTISVITFLGSSIANLIGYGPEFESFVAGLTNAIKSLFTNKDKNRLEKGFLSFAAVALENLEGIDFQLKEIDTFTFQSKFLGIEVALTKTKEDLIKEVSDAYAEAIIVAQDIEQTTILEGLFGGLVGALPFIGQTLDEAINPTENLVTLTREQLSYVQLLTGSQSAYNDEISDALSITARTLVESLKGADLLSFEARKYLQTQLLIAATLQGQESVLGRTQLIAEQLGITAAQVADNFNVQRSEVEGISSILEGISNLPDITTGISVRILNEEELLTRLAALSQLDPGKVYDFVQTTEEAAGLARDNYSELTSGLYDTGESVVSLNNDLITLQVTTNSFFDSFIAGGLNLEQLSQGLGTVSESVVSLESDYARTQATLNRLTELRGFVVDEQTRAAISKSIALLQTELDIIGSQVDLGRQQIEVLKSQVQPVMDILYRVNQLNQAFSRQIDLASVSFGEISINGQLALTELQKTANTQEIINSLIESGNNEYLARNKYLDDINNLSESLNLTTEQEVRLQNATKDTIADIIDSIRIENELNEEKVGLLNSLVALSSLELALAEQTSVALQVQIGFFKENIQLIESITNSLRGQTDVIEQQIRAQERLNAEIVVQNKITELEMQLEEINATSEILVNTFDSFIESAETSANSRQSAYSAELEQMQRLISFYSSVNDLTLARNALELQRASIIRDTTSRELGNKRELLQQTAGSLLELLDINISVDNLNIKEISSIVDNLRNAIQAQEDVINFNILASGVQYMNQLRILELEENAANLDFVNRKITLDLELSLLSQRRSAAKDELSTMEKLELLRQQRAKIETAADLASLTTEQQLIEENSRLAEVENSNQLRAAIEQRDLELSRYTNVVEEIRERYNLLSAQNASNEAFFNEYARLLSEEMKIRVGENAPIIESSYIREEYANTIDELSQGLSVFETTLNDLLYSRMGVIGQERRLNQERFDQQRVLIAREIESREELAAREMQIAREVAATRKAETENTISSIIDEEAILYNQIEILSTERLRSEEYFNSERIRLFEEFSNTIKSVENYQELANIYDGLLNQITNFTEESENTINSLRSSLIDLQNERIILDIELKIADIDLASQIREQLGRARIDNIQAQIQLVESQEEGKLLSAVEAAERVNSLQLKVLAIEEKLTMDRIKSDILTMQLESELLKQRAIIEQESIKAQASMQIAEVKNNFQLLSGLATTFAEAISGQQTLFQSFVSAIAKTFSSAANAFNAAIVAGLNKASVGAAVAEGIVAEIDTGVLLQSVDVAQATTAELSASISAVAEQQISNLQTQTQAEQAAINSRIAAAQQEAGILADTAELRRQIQQQDYQNTLADAAGGGGGGGGEDAAEKAAELINSINEKLAGAFSEAKDAIIEIASSLLDVIGEQLTRIQQSRIDTLAAQEELISGAVENTSSRLSEVQSTLNSTLEEEVSLRDQILEQTKALSQAQSDYLSSISSENRNIVQSSEEYVNKLVEQKNSILALSQASVKRTALQREEKSLAEIQISQQQALATTTNARVEAEAKLEQTQQLLSFASELLSGSFTQLGDSMIAAVQKIQTALQMLGLAQDANIPITGVISSILNPAQQALTEFNEEIQNLTELGTSAISSATNSLNSSVEAVAQATQSAGNTMTQQLSRTAEIFGKVSGIISGALTGFQIGGAISQLVGDTGWATTIGGTIGGAIASAFIPAISGFISGVFPAAASFLSGSLGTALLGVAVPIVGSILGALLGSLFKKTPRASASGEVRGGEVNLLSTSASGGARRTTAEALGDIGVGTFESIISSLEQAGLEFTSSLKFSIKMTKDSISDATVTFSDGLRKFSSGALGKGQDAAKAAGEFFVDSFFKGIRVGDVVVSDALVVASDNIQRAIDTFAGLSDEALRTAESFSEAIEFARDFNNSIATLRGAASSTAQVFDLISKAAIANGQNLARSYREFIEETANVFGDSSAQYQIAQQAVRQNALAQAGLAEITVGTTKQLVPLRDALEQVNAGAVLIRETVANIEGLLPALRQAGITNISEVISTGVKQAVETIVGDIGDSLAVAISILQNPAKAAITELEAIIENGEARTRELSGQLNQLSAEQLRGAAITNEAIASARENVTLSRELLGLEIDTYLRSLTAAELEAISATDRLTDAQLALVEAQLAGIRAISNQRALASLLDSSNKINESVAKLTDSFSAINFDNIIGVAVDLGTISESLNRESVDSFTISLRNAIDNIVNGVSSVDNYSASIVAINSEHNDGKLTAEEYASAIEILNSATSEYLDTINDLVDEYESVVSSISEVLEDAKRSVSDSLSTLSDTIISAFRELVDSSADIISTYDDLVADITDAGNSLFDLQDKANDALTEATKAIADFEKENKLSGKTSSQVANELEAVNARIEELLRNPVDLAQFIELSGLTSQQRVLSGELSKLTTLEEEYTTLLEERARAEEDVAGIQSLIEQAGQSLIDSRSKESELMAEASEALNRYLSGQEQLLEINQLLAESNFNINQERAREAEFLDNIRESLDRYNSSLSTLTENITSAGLESSILSAALALGFEQSDLEDAAGLFATLNSTIQNIGSASISQLNDALLSSQTSFDALTSVFGEEQSSAIDSFANALSILNESFDIVNAVDGLSSAIAELNSATDSSGLPQLINNFSDIKQAILNIPDLAATEGSIAAIRDAVSSIGETILDSWNTVKNNFETTLAGSFNVVATIPAGGTLSSSDSATLNSIDNFSGITSSNTTAIKELANLYPREVGVEYQDTYGRFTNLPTFSSGGPVNGPGTSTSDSIHAKLSNGEYVINAASASSIGYGILDILNATGDIRNVLNEDALRIRTSNMPSVNAGEANTVGDIQVNIINNGTSQTVAEQPTIRKENGKFVIDVVLEDLRNNGPIKRQLKSIR